MKRLIISILWLLIIIVLFPSEVSADVIAPNTHQVSRSVKFVNLEEFPDIVLIGYETGVQNYSNTFQIQNNVPLHLGYYHNQLSIYWNTKDKSSSIDRLDLNNFIAKIYPDSEWRNNSDPLVKEDVQYSIAGFSDKKLVIYISERTSEYNNGSPAKTETFSSPLGNTEPIRTPPSELGKNEPINPSITEPVKPDPTLNTSFESKTGFWQSLLYEQKFLFALLLTWVIEIIVAVIFIKYLFKYQEIKISKIVFVGLIASALTLPFLWFILPIYISNRVLFILLGEISVILVEAIIYYQFLKLRLPQSFVISFVANAASILLGIVLF